MIPRTIKAVANVVCVALITGVAVGVLLDRRVQYATSRSEPSDIDRASLDISRLSRP